MFKLLIFFIFFLITETIYSEIIVPKDLPKQLEQPKEIHYQKKTKKITPKYLEQDKETTKPKKITLKYLEQDKEVSLRKKVLFTKDVKIHDEREEITTKPLSKNSDSPSKYRLQEKQKREEEARAKREINKNIALWIGRILHFFGISKPEKKDPLHQQDVIVK